MGGHVNPRFRSTAENRPDDQDDYEYEDEEESLSLRDLPLTQSRSSSAVHHHHTTTTRTSSANHSRRSSSPDFFFEFLVDDDHHQLITSFADDVIFHGRLLPLFNPPPPRRSLSLSSATVRAAMNHRSDSPLPENRGIRPSRSLDCRKLRRNSIPKAELRSRNNPSKIDKTRNNSDPKALPWYWLVFGLPVRMPAEMELKDIKTRQFRRNSPPVSLFSGDWERFSDQKSSSASWRLLSVLSCRSHVSVDVKDGVVSRRFPPKYHVKDTK